MPPPPPRVVTSRRRSFSNPEGMEKWSPKDRNRLHFVLPASILEEELAEASAALKAKEQMDEESEANECEEEEEEEFLDEDELLRRARSRLLEDLSEGNLTGEKGVLTLPHSLTKYKEVSGYLVERQKVLKQHPNISRRHLRFTTRMVVSEFIHLLREQQSLADSRANDLAEFGIRKSDTTAERILPTAGCASRVAS
jgi:hypothetical protein